MGGVLGPYLELDPINSIQIPSSKLTWQWRSTFSSRKCTTNDGISMNFHCYVSLPECTKNSHIQQKVKPSRWVSFRSFSWGCTLKNSSFAMSPTSQNIHNIYIYIKVGQRFKSTNWWCWTTSPPQFYGHSFSKRWTSWVFFGLIFQPRCWWKLANASTAHLENSQQQKT